MRILTNDEIDNAICEADIEPGIEADQAICKAQQRVTAWEIVEQCVKMADRDDGEAISYWGHVAKNIALWLLAEGITRMEEGNDTTR